MVGFLFRFFNKISPNAIFGWRQSDPTHWFSYLDHGGFYRMQKIDFYALLWVLIWSNGFYEVSKLLIVSEKPIVCEIEFDCLCSLLKGLFQFLNNVLVLITFECDFLLMRVCFLFIYSCQLEFVNTWLDCWLDKINFHIIVPVYVKYFG